jgi:hypothetical protein
MFKAFMPPAPVIESEVAPKLWRGHEHRAPCVADVAEIPREEVGFVKRQLPLGTITLEIIAVVSSGIRVCHMLGV